MSLPVLGERLRGARDALLGDGWFRLSGAVDPAICESLRLPGDDARWQPLDAQVGRVYMSGWYHQPTRAELPTTAVTLANGLVDALRAELHGLAAPDEFNEFSWQRHVPGNHAVTTHRDQSVYTGLVAVITLIGTARFSIHNHQDGPEVHGLDTSTGDLVILRAAGLTQPEAPRPWHSVAAPTSEERQTITMRHSLREPGWW